MMIEKDDCQGQTVRHTCFDPSPSLRTSSSSSSYKLNPSQNMAVFWTLLRLVKVLIQIIALPFCKCLSPFLKPFRRHPPKPDYSCDIVLVTGAAQGIGKALSLEVSLYIPFYTSYFILVSTVCLSHLLYVCCLFISILVLTIPYVQSV